MTKQLRSFTLAQLEQASLDHAAYCINCGTTKDGCDASARQLRCTSCRQPAVYGADAILRMGLVCA